MSRDATMEPSAAVLDAERAVLGAMLLEPAAITEAYRHLTPERMWTRSHQLVFRAMLAMHVAGKPVDLIGLGHTLTSRGELAESGGVEALAKLLDHASTSGNVAHHAATVSADWLRRERIRLGRDYLSAAHDPALAADHLQRIRDLEESGSTAHSAWAEASLDWGSLSRLDIPPTPSIAGPDGLLPVGGLIFLSGGPAAGKTFLAMQLALALGSGGEWLGHTCRPRRVGFLELEMNPAGMRSRIVRSAPHAGLENIHALCMPRGGTLITDRDVRRRMVEWIRRLELQDVFIDPLNRLQNDTGNITKDARAELSGLHAIREETGATLFVLHHIRKGPPGDKKQASTRMEDVHSMRGSAQYSDDADTMLTLEERHEGLRLLKWSKVRHAETPEPSWLARSETGFFHVTSSPEEAAVERKGDTQAGLLSMLAQAGAGGVSVVEVMDSLGMSRRTAQRHLPLIGAAPLPGFRGSGQRWVLPQNDARQVLE